MIFQPKILPAGDQAILIELGREIKPEINQQVHYLGHLLEKRAPLGIKEIIPSYSSLLIYYDPAQISFREISDLMQNFLPENKPKENNPPVIKEIPVVYGGEYGPDLEFVAQFHGLTVEEVIKLHTSQTYLVYVVGFSPGFAAMGTVPENIQTPRLPTPRTKVPAGSVGIGGKQTGIYAVESPGGWRLIGRTPLTLFDLNNEPPAFFKAGDYARFFAVAPEDFSFYQKQKRNFF
ncbi:MAG: 5-oxoprolinase subunit PxpB [Thermodesulfobacteriota bacterium]